ncbi:MAG: hypothetical protein H6799_02830 [Candidatus Nomurabacteria bacterium]|nr:MAG: hypothetical protein H6799_02830 [Candidatus Nomurabacteria bacterium]HRV76431.1 hypothetical protein [Candidatus Saccharimonadales bacterium]
MNDITGSETTQQPQQQSLGYKISSEATWSNGTANNWKKGTLVWLSNDIIVFKDESGTELTSIGIDNIKQIESRMNLLIITSTTGEFNYLLGGTGNTVGAAGIIASMSSVIGTRVTDSLMKKSGITEWISLARNYPNILIKSRSTSSDANKVLKWLGIALAVFILLSVASGLISS